MKEIYVRTKLVNGTYVYAPKGTKDTYGTVLIDNDTLKYNDEGELKVDANVINIIINKELTDTIDRIKNTTSNLENGDGTGSVVQKRLKSDGVTWTKAKAYQGASIALGGGTQAGMTEEEFNAWYWDSTTNTPLHEGKGKINGKITDYTGKDYEHSYAYSVASGDSTRVKGRASFGSGSNNLVEGRDSAVFGRNNKLKNDCSLAAGENNTINTVQGFATGEDNIVDGGAGSALGKGLHQKSPNGTSVGQFNDPTDTNGDKFNIFEVGCGTDENNRKNAFFVTQDGEVCSNKKPASAREVVRLTDLQEATKNLSSDSSLNLLETKLNENIIKNPDYTYIITTATSFNLSSPPFASEFSIDWGDGTTGNQNNPTHTYTDGYTYHLLTIKNITGLDSGFSYSTTYSKSFIEIYMGKNAVFNLNGSSGVDAFSNLRKVVYQEGITLINLPNQFEGTIIIPKSCTQITLAPYQNSKISKIVIQNTDPAAFTIVSPYLSYVDKIVVPKSAINAYKTASKWSAFADKIVYEVDSGDLEDKVSKFTDTASFDRAYIHNANGQDSAAYIDGGVSEYSLIRRNAGGTAKVAKGVADDDIANMSNLKEVNVIYVSNTLLGE